MAKRESNKLYLRHNNLKRQRLKGRLSMAIKKGAYEMRRVSCYSFKKPLFDKGNNRVLTIILKFIF